MLADPVLFWRSFHEHAPWDFQQEDIRRMLARDENNKFEHRIAINSMPRQNSKTTISAVSASCLFFCDPEVKSVVSVALDRESARILLSDAKQLINNNDVLLDMVDPSWGMTKSSIRLKDGSTWVIKSADGRMSRGLRPQVICFHELGFSADDGDLLHTLRAGQGAQRNPIIIVTSTVSPVMAGPLWDLFQASQQGDPSILLIYRTENVSPLISKEYLDSERRQLPPGVYAREHLNEWSSGTDAYTNYEAWEIATGQGDPTRKQFGGPAYLFLDIGISADETAWAVAAKTDDGVDVISLEYMQGSKRRPLSFDRLKKRLKKTVARFGVTKMRIESYQGFALGQELHAELPNVAVKITHATSKTQNEIWSSLSDHLRNGTIRLPKDEKLRRQLLGLVVKQTPSGSWRIVDVNKKLHQDRALATAGAVLMSSNPGVSMFDFIKEELDDRAPVDEDPDPEYDSSGVRSSGVTHMKPTPKKKVEPKPPASDLYIEEGPFGPKIRGGTLVERVAEAQRLFRRDD